MTHATLEQQKETRGCNYFIWLTYQPKEQKEKKEESQKRMEECA